ncbi:excisionase family protein [Endozoicomonas sp.]|uniref:excisionase family protein n=1 Tax=Endozoicomonas sp. TaxID=1892382 RepID=UPI00383A352E
MMEWVKTNKYYEISGDTKNAFYQKIRRGMLLEGVHYKKAEDGRIWVNLKAVEKWVSDSSSIH